MVKKKSVKSWHHFTAGLTLVIILFAVFILILNGLDNKPIPEMSKKMQIHDFESEKEGVFSGQLNSNYPKEEVDPVVVLFSSEKIIGLSLIYYHNEQKIVAGTPPLVAENVILFDNKPHWISYQFTEDGKQYFFYDNEMIASSKFKPVESNSLTGFATGSPQFYVSSLFDTFDMK